MVLDGTVCADRMALGLPAITDRLRGDMDAVKRWRDMAQKLAYHVNCYDSQCGREKPKCEACSLLESFKQLDAPALTPNASNSATGKITRLEPLYDFAERIELENKMLRVKLADCAAYLAFHGPVGSTPDSAKLLLQDVQRVLSPNDPS